MGVDSKSNLELNDEYGRGICIKKGIDYKKSCFVNRGLDVVAGMIRLLAGRERPARWGFQSGNSRRELRVSPEPRKGSG